MRIIRLPETLSRTGLSRTRLYEAIGRGHFPAPVKLAPGARAIGFVEAEVEAYIEGRMAEREVA